MFCKCRTKQVAGIGYNFGRRKCELECKNKIFAKRNCTKKRAKIDFFKSLAEVITKQMNNLRIYKWGQSKNI